MSIEALIDGEFATTVLKDLDRRVRPIAVQDNHFANSWFQDDGNGITGTGSFPSGHAMAAFAIASVISRRYGHRRWIPLMAYGIASAIGLSRVTLCSHFSSDVFAGAVLGELIGQKLPLGERPSP
jgi:membrane-associated phospholipid phosphatase